MHKPVAIAVSGGKHAELIVRINADNPLVDPHYIDELVADALACGAEYESFVVTVCDCAGLEVGQGFGLPGRDEVDDIRIRLVYERGESGGEKRLVGKKSAGIGGHINPVLDSGGTNAEEYALSLCREAGEELGEAALKALIGPLQPVAAIHDRSNAVSRVHLGFVHVVRTNKRLPLTSSELCIKNPQYVPIKELVMEELEVWSQLAVKAIDWTEEG